MLISDTDPGPYTIFNESGKAAVILICDHASNKFPKAMNSLGLNAAQVEDHIAWDIGAENVARFLARKLDAVLVICGYSRLLIDCNRPVGDPGSILEKSDHVPVPGNQNLTDAGKQLRVDNFFSPYHEAIDGVVNKKINAGDNPAVLSIHSFTPQMKSEGTTRPWHFCIMSEDDDRRLANPFISALRDMNIGVVGDNEPYAGKDVGYSLRIHAGNRRLMNVGVEIRQDLVDNDQKAQVYANHLAAALQGINLQL
jgi:predicted N-formylglutamate amidohydrolase